MNTRIAVPKRGVATPFALLCAMSIVPVAFGAVDITAFVRDFGPGSYHAYCGNGTTVNGGLIGNAFDGVTSGGDGQNGTTDVRVLLQSTNSGGATIPTPVSVLYYIDGEALNCFDFRVTSFTLHRLTAGWNALARSATQFRLDGYDGAEWHLLFQTDEAQTWDEGTL